MKAEVLADASRLLHRATGSRGYAVAYGSHARGRAGPRSDLDLLVVNHVRLDRTAQDRLIEDVKCLHYRHGLDLDEEVPYAIKLTATAAEVAAATAFHGFVIHPDGLLSVPQLTPSPEYLASTPFKLRLILNALTGPLVFIGGNPWRFEHDHRRACLAITLLALSILCDCDAVSASSAADVLIRDPRTGVTGKDYLGYSNDDLPHLFGLLQQGFACLVSTGVLQQVDGATLDQSHNMRLLLVQHMAARRRGLRPGITNEIGRPAR